VGATTLKDSLRCAKQRGIVCMTGMVGNKWSFDNFSPMDAIPTAVSLTTYAGESEDFMLTPLEELAEQTVAGTLHVQVGRTFHLDEIAEARIAAWRRTRRAERSWCRPSSAPEGDRHREDQAGASPARTAACSGERLPGPGTRMRGAARFTEQASSTVNRQHKEAGETRRARSKLIRARQCG
jgi:hypothetical protein